MPVSTFELFGTSIEVVVDKIKDVKAWATAFKTFIPHRQKASVATHAHPTPRSRLLGPLNVMLFFFVGLPDKPLFNYHS